MWMFWVIKFIEASEVTFTIHLTYSFMIHGIDFIDVLSKALADLFQHPKEDLHLPPIITLCMKLSWFFHTNSGQLFCNCPLFVIALVPGLFSGGKPDETCCHAVVASKWLKTRVSQFALQDENTTTWTQTEIIKSLAVQRLKKLEEHCIHHFKLINYDYVNIMDH